MNGLSSGKTIYFFSSRASKLAVHQLAPSVFPVVARRVRFPIFPQLVEKIYRFSTYLRENLGEIAIGYQDDEQEEDSEAEAVDECFKSGIHALTGNHFNHNEQKSSAV